MEWCHMELDDGVLYIWVRFTLEFGNRGLDIAATYIEGFKWIYLDSYNVSNSIVLWAS